MKMRLLGWLCGLIEDVPADIAACEYACRKPNCEMGEWEKCERRLFIAEEERRQKIRRLTQRHAAFPVRRGVGA